MSSKNRLVQRNVILFWNVFAERSHDFSQSVSQWLNCGEFNTIALQPGAILRVHLKLMDVLSNWALVMVLHLLSSTCSNTPTPAPAFASVYSAAVAVVWNASLRASHQARCQHCDVFFSRFTALKNFLSLFLSARTYQEHARLIQTEHVKLIWIVLLFSPCSEISQ